MAQRLEIGGPKFLESAAVGRLNSGDPGPGLRKYSGVPARQNTSVDGSVAAADRNHPLPRPQMPANRLQVICLYIDR